MQRLRDSPYPSGPCAQVVMKRASHESVVHWQKFFGNLSHRAGLSVLRRVSMSQRMHPFHDSWPSHSLSVHLGVVIAATLALLSVAAGAQTAPVRRQSTVPGHSAGAPHQEPCWQVAGISKSAMEQRHSIQQNSHSQVEAVCADSSLTAQQRNQKIRQIHEQAKQQMDALVSPQQMQSLKACQSSRAAAHPSTGGHHVGGVASSGGPCGEMPGRPGSGNPAGSQGNKPEPENDVEN